MEITTESIQLVRGKIFHKLIQPEWLNVTKDGKPKPEKYIKMVDGKKVGVIF
jgi:hypothetical protein